MCRGAPASGWLPGVVLGSDGLGQGCRGLVVSCPRCPEWVGWERPACRALRQGGSCRDGDFRLPSGLPRRLSLFCLPALGFHGSDSLAKLPACTVPF